MSITSASAILPSSVQLSTSSTIKVSEVLTRLTSSSSRDGAALTLGVTRHMAATRSHAVLNSLSLDFIAASFASLGEGGAFEEIGKRGIWALQRRVTAAPRCACCGRVSNGVWNDRTGKQERLLLFGCWARPALARGWFTGRGNEIRTTSRRGAGVLRS